MLATRQPTYSWGELTATVARAMDIPQSKVSWALGQLALRGLFPRERTGHGRRVRYTSDHLLRALFTFELRAIGITGPTARAVIDEYFDAFYQAFHLGRTLEIRRPVGLGRQARIFLNLRHLKLTACGELPPTR